MKEIERKSSEYYLPVEEEPNAQVFVFNGFVREADRLFFDIDYDMPGRFHGMVLRTAIDDSHSYKVINHVLWTGEPHYANKPVDYDKTIYDSSVVRAWHKRLSLEQLSVFASLVNGIVEEVGLENVVQEDIFENEDVRKILGLDQEGPFDYTPVKKNDETRIAEFV